MLGDPLTTADQSPPGGTNPKFPGESLKFVQPAGRVYVSVGLNVRAVCVPAGTSPRHVPPKGCVHCALSAVISRTGTAATWMLLTIASVVGRTSASSFDDADRTAIASLCTTEPMRIGVRYTRTPDAPVDHMVLLPRDRNDK